MRLGGAEVFAVLFLVLGHIAVILIAATWMYRDAKSRGDQNAAIWAVGGILAWLPVLIVYLIVRSNRPGSQPQ